MIINRKEVKEALRGLVGFYQTTNPNYSELIPSLLETRSNRKVNDVHPLLNDVENIDQSIKNFSKFDYPEWDALTQYEDGSKVAVGVENYESIVDAPAIGVSPVGSSEWELINEFSDYLIKQYDAGVDMMLDDWINDKNLRFKITSIFEKVMLFNGFANYSDTEDNRDNVVGLRIRMKVGEQSLKVLINRIGSHFVGSFVELDLFLWHSSQQLPLAQIQLDSVSKNFRWNSVDDQWTMSYVDETLQAGGEFFIGYKQSQLKALNGSALNMRLDWRGKPCDCDSDWIRGWEQYTKFIDVTGFNIEESKLGDNNEMFDPEDVAITYTKNYGLNLDMDAKCDIGYFVKRREELFADAISKAVGFKLIQAMAYNVRGGNQVANVVRDQAKKELFENEGIQGTLADKYKASIKALSFDMSSLGEACFPCDEPEDEIFGTATIGVGDYYNRNTIPVR